MGENFFFVGPLLLAASHMIVAQQQNGQIEMGSTTAWQVGLGVVFWSGVLFLLLSMLGVREKLLEAVSPSMRNGIAVGIGMFIVLIGLKNAGLLLTNKDTGWMLNHQFASPDLLVFFFGLLVTAALHARRIRGSIILGILAATALSIALKLGVPHFGEWLTTWPPVKNSQLLTQFNLAHAHEVVGYPPPITPTLWKLDFRVR